MLTLHQKRYSNVKVSCFIASFPLTFFKEKKKAQDNNNPQILSKVNQFLVQLCISKFFEERQKPQQMC